MTSSSYFDDMNSFSGLLDNSRLYLPESGTSHFYDVPKPVYSRPFSNLGPSAAYPCEAYDISNSTVSSSTSLDVRNWTHKTEDQFAQYGASFYPEASQHIPATMSNAQQAPLTFDAADFSTHDCYRRRSSAVASTGPSVHDTVYCSSQNSSSHLHSTMADIQSRHATSHTSVDNTASFTSLTPPYGQASPSFSRSSQNSSASSYIASPALVSHPSSPRAVPHRQKSRMVPSFTSTPYPPTRSSSTPNHSVSPEATVLHVCKWFTDGMICGELITKADISDHLATHGIKNLPHDALLRCQWCGCQLRKDKEWMNRESIVRHIREKHLGYRRNTR